jgi:hypothetical protein
MVGITVQQRPWLCVLEFMQFGDLRAVLKAADERNLSLFAREYMTMALQVTKGMEFITSKVRLNLARVLMWQWFLSCSQEFNPPPSTPFFIT